MRALPCRRRQSRPTIRCAAPRVRFGARQRRLSVPRLAALPPVGHRHDRAGPRAVAAGDFDLRGLLRADGSEAAAPVVRAARQRQLRGAGRQLQPVAICLSDGRDRRVRSGHLPADHRTRQDEPHAPRLFREGLPLPSPVAHPGRPPFLRLDERQALSPARHRQVRSRHPLPRHHRIARLADHRADRRHDHDRRGNQHRHHVRLSRRQASTPGSNASSSSSSHSRSCRSIWR